MFPIWLADTGDDIVRQIVQAAVQGAPRYWLNFNTITLAGVVLGILAIATIVGR